MTDSEEYVIPYIDPESDPFEDVDKSILDKAKSIDAPTFEMITKTNAKDPTHAVFGMTTAGEVLTRQFSTAPHTLVTGATGSGKSVFLNQCLISMIAHSSPKQLKLAIVDPKKVEFGVYKGLPHLMCEVITDMNEASALLAYLTWEMDRRYKLMEEMKIRNIIEYQKVTKDKPDAEYIPYMVVLIDEYADLVATNKEVEPYIARLGQKARACGIHLILATQTPRAEVITGIIKANVPSRVVMTAATSGESLIALGESGAEKLNGKGDMYVKWYGSNDIIRCQSGFIPDEVINTILTWIKINYPRPKYVDFMKVVEDNGLNTKGRGRGMGAGASRMSSAGPTRSGASPTTSSAISAKQSGVSDPDEKSIKKDRSADTKKAFAKSDKEEIVVKAENKKFDEDEELKSALNDYAKDYNKATDDEIEGAVNSTGNKETSEEDEQVAAHIQSLHFGNTSGDIVDKIRESEKQAVSKTQVIGNKKPNKPVRNRSNSRHTQRNSVRQETQKDRRVSDRNTNRQTVRKTRSDHANRQSGDRNSRVVRR